jgi:hypothetical protein
LVEVVMTAPVKETEQILAELVVKAQSATLEAAAKVAAIYGAPPEAIAAILRLKVAS